MIKKILITIILTISSFAVDNLIGQKQDVLYVQNLIEKEEMIAKSFEKYLLNEFEIPTIGEIPKIEKLRTDEYLGTNFSIKNRMGADFVLSTSSSEIKLNYGINGHYLIKVDNDYGYVVQLYNRDLYRNNTYVIFDKNTNSNSYIEIELQSKEAKNIYKILTTKDKNGKDNKIEKTCPPKTPKTYCSNDERTIRWYENETNWVEYSKKDFIDGNVNINGDSEEIKNKIKELKVGSHIFVNGKKPEVLFFKENE